MTHKILTALLAMLVLAGCGGESKSSTDPSPSTREVTFTEIDDQTDSDDYKIASSAQGSVDSFGAELTLGFIISNANGIIVNPKATIKYADGSTQTCQETDLRRLPSLAKSTTSWDFPCEASFGDPAGAVVTVTDEYH
jgi:filamentous hemagglutinin family protein